VSGNSKPWTAFRGKREKNTTATPKKISIQAAGKAQSG
jgi:hypothetical protein